MNEFVFDGTASSTFKAYVASSNFMDGAERNVSTFHIPGRNGDLTIDEGSFKNFPVRMQVYIKENIAANSDSLKNYLAARSNTYYVLSETLDPNVFRLARYVGPYEMGVSDRKAGALDLLFDSKPQKFLLSGQTEQSFTANGSLLNPTAFDAKPLIKIYGTGTVGIGSQSITVDSSYSGSSITIDCEEGEIYSGTQDMGSYVSFSGIDFPVLHSGSNGITLGSGITKVEITPRWWKL